MFIFAPVNNNNINNNNNNNTAKIIETICISNTCHKKIKKMKQTHQNFKDFLNGLDYPKVRFWRENLKDGNKGIAIGYSTFVLWSKFDCKPNESNLDALAKITGIPADELFLEHK